MGWDGILDIDSRDSMIILTFRWNEESKKSSNTPSIDVLWN